MKLREKDIHNHLLPGLDDGFRKVEDSLLAIQKMASAGCREIVFTPHMNSDVYPGMDETICRKVYDSFIPFVPADITTHLAVEYMVVPGFEEKVANSADTLLAFPDKSVLIEMSYYYRSQNLERTIFELNMAGFKPILAHPERYLYMAESLKDFDKIVSMGCRLQLNFISITGKYGPQSVKIMDYLLNNRMYSFVATDLHSVQQLDRILTFKPGFFMERKLRRSGIE